MHYELVSRALAYVSCLSTMSLFATSMAIAAVNVGKPQPQFAKLHPVSAIARADVAGLQFGGLLNKTHVEAVAAVLWSRKI
jgi:hypothetical protein